MVGEGSIIVEQEPAKGQAQPGLVCRLGRGDESYATNAGDLPQRQALLLEKLGDTKLAVAN